MPEPERKRACSEVLRAAEEGRLEIVTSAITLTEVIKLKGRPPITPENKARIALFFQNPYIVIYSLTRFIGDEARELIWRHARLWPKDAVHLATAIYAGIQEIHSYDQDFLVLNEKLGEGIRINHPRTDQPSLPFKETEDGEASETEVAEMEAAELEELSEREESDKPDDSN